MADGQRAVLGQEGVHSHVVGEELDRREAYALDGAGSTRGWLAQQPTGRTPVQSPASAFASAPDGLSPPATQRSTEPVLDRIEQQLHHIIMTFL